MSNTPKPYRIEALPIRDGDVIILHLSNDLDLDSVYSIQKDVQKEFPNNKVLCANDNILKSITVLQSDTTFYGVDLSLNGELMF